MDIIDVHTHILFGIDDGAKTAEQSLELLQAAYDGGTRGIFFTPHNVKAGFDFEKAKESLDELRPLVQKRFPDLNIYGGCEIMYSHSVAESIVSKQLPSLAGSQYVLIEFMPGIFYSELLSAVRRLVSHGCIPLIAHAERCINLKKSNVPELIESGALIQLNASSVMGKRGFAIKSFCASLIKKGYVFCIASDAHDIDSRGPDLGACAKYVAKKFGDSTAERLFYKNPNRIVNNK